MNIQEALSTINQRRNFLERVDKAISVAEHPPSPTGRQTRLRTYVGVEDVGDIIIKTSREDAIKMLRAAKAEAEAEIAKLQPVVDMANAALKGVLS